MKIYGVSLSRAGRTLWCAYELDLDFEHIPSMPMSDTLKPEFKAINPNAKVPVLDDDGFILWESMAINLYLARKAGRLLPTELQGMADVDRWSFWTSTTFEPQALALLFNSHHAPVGEFYEEGFNNAKERLKPLFEILESALQDRDYLLGADFSLADLNTAFCFQWIKAAELVTDEWPRTTAWADRCLTRPSAAKL